MGDMTHAPFVPAHFVPPAPPECDGFTLVPLCLDHNEGDLDAWSSSVDHIHATPGFAGHPWPDEPMTLERNARDLAGHASDFAHRRGFTYSVVSTVGNEVIGCVYIYPSAKEDVEADVRSWVRASRAMLDTSVYETVLRWLRADWPFGTFDYAPRGTNVAPQPASPGAEPTDTS
jgi:hypothetical protein